MVKLHCIEIFCFYQLVDLVVIWCSDITTLNVDLLHKKSLNAGTITENRW